MLNWPSAAHAEHHENPAARMWLLLNALFTRKATPMHHCKLSCSGNASALLFEKA
jgi:hypothetical protein